MHDQMRRLYLAAKTIKSIEGQSALAHAFTISPQVVNNWEARGISNKGMILAQRILGCSPAWIETGEGEMVGATTELEAAAPGDDAEGLVYSEQIIKLIANFSNSSQEGKQFILELAESSAQMNLHKKNRVKEHRP